MRKFECGVCGFVYDPEKGLPEQGIPPGTPFEDLPPDFECPVCGAAKTDFSPLPASGGDASNEPVQVQATIRVSRAFGWRLPIVSGSKPGSTFRSV
jgi:rubredoxin